MSDPGNNTKKQGPDISVEEVKEQLFGQHSDPVKKKIEGSEFYSAAMDGLKAVPDAESFDNVMNDLHKNISKQSGYKTAHEISQFRKKWMIAASLTLGAIILGSVLFINIGKENRLADKNSIIESKKNEKSTSLNNTPQIIPDKDTEISEIPVDSETEDVQEPISPANEKQDETVAAVAVESDEPNVSESLKFSATETTEETPQEIAEVSEAVEEDAEDYYSSTPSPETEITPAASRAVTPAAADIVVTEELSRSTNTAESTNVTIESAMNAYNNGEFSKAIEQFDVLLKSYPGNRKANYYAGVSYMNIGKSSKAIKHFDELINSSGTTYKDSSKWLKANILVKKGRKNDARKLLEDLSQRQNRYSQQAKDLLQTL